MRRAVAEATHHAAHRSAFGRLLAEQPLMRNVLADLCVESEAATITALRLARAFDEADVPFRRLATAVAQVLDLQANAAARRRSAGMPRRQRLRRGVAAAAPLPREPAQLDLGRVRQRERARRPARARARARDRGRVPRRGSARRRRGRAPGRGDRRLEHELAEPEEEGARRLLELLAVSLQGSLLVRHGAPEVADAFCASRLDRPGGVFGTLPSSLDFGAIVERHRPQI